MNGYDERAASQMLGHEVRFIYNQRCGRGRRRAIRAVVNEHAGRWATQTEWEEFVRQQLHVSPTMTLAPIRAREEDTCPCPGCGRCACRWIDETAARCDLPECICPRVRVPVRLALRLVDAQRLELQLCRGTEVLYVMGSWGQRRGWDLTPAGDAKTRSLMRVLPQVVARWLARDRPRFSTDVGDPVLPMGML